MWIEKVREEAPRADIIMVRNKSDLSISNNGDCINYCKQNGIMMLNCSAKTGEGIDQLLTYIIITLKGKEVIERRCLDKCQKVRRKICC